MPPLPPILTLTGNLLSEHTLKFGAWAAGQTQRASGESFQVGGKGVNVAKMLRRLKVPTTALVFSGGASGTRCEEWLRLQPFSFQAFRTANSTRTGVVIRSDSQAETTFLGPDAAPDADAVKSCAAFLDQQPSGHVLAICGSIPGWAEPHFDPLRTALTRWSRRGILVVDTYGPPLAWLVTLPLSLVKINSSEFSALFPSEATPAHTSTLIDRAAKLWPVKRWVVSDGRNPLWFGSKDKPPAMLMPPSIVEVSPTGSGDVLFACILEAIFGRQRPFAEAVAAAMPFAAANAAHPGIAEFPDP